MTAPLPAHRLEDRHAHQPEAAGADHQHRLVLDDGAELLQRRIGRHTRAGVGRDRDGIEPVERQQIFRVRNDDLIGIAAVAMNAEAARLHAKIFVAVAADAAGSAADPGIDEHDLADFAVRHIGADGQDLAGCFMAERQGQRNAAILQHQALAAAEIVAAFPDMQIGVTYAGGLDRDDDLVTGRRADPAGRSSCSGRPKSMT